MTRECCWKTKSEGHLKAAVMFLGLEVSTTIADHYYYGRDNTTTDDDYEGVIQRPLEVEAALTVTLLTIIFICLSGNVTVLLAFMKSPELREQISSVFIVNLAIADVSCATTVMPFCLVSIWFDHWIFGTFTCGMVCFLNYCFIIVSMWTLALISIDRHLYCIYPFLYANIMSHRRALVLALMAWTLGLTFGSLPSLLKLVTYDHAEIICAVDWENDHVKVLTYTISAFVICFMTPLVVMVYCYRGLNKIAHRHAKQLQRRTTGQIVAEPTCISNFYNDDNIVEYLGKAPSNSVDRRKKETRVQEHRTSRSSKAIRSICIMIAAYLVCNTPFSLTKLLKCVYSNNGVVPFYFNAVASWIAFINPCCNPIIYSIYREDFKYALRKLFPSLLSVKISPTNKAGRDTQAASLAPPAATLAFRSAARPTCNLSSL